ncbi:unnamed protein product [Urochloa humidicola]
MATPPVVVGPFGSSLGKYHDVDDDPPKSLLSITVASSKNGKGGQIQGIKFSYINAEGKEKESPTWGNLEKGTKTTVTVNGGEYVREVKGTGELNIKSLTIIKDNGDEYVLGDPGTGMEFDIPLEKGMIVGFIARASTVLNAVGVYVGPN